MLFSFSFPIPCKETTDCPRHSDRTLDYLFDRNPEAYQAHVRRVSANKVASNNSREKKKKEKKSSNTKKQDANPPAPYAAHAWDPDHNPDLPIGLYEPAPLSSPILPHHPNSAPAVLPSTTQGEVRIVVEPEISPRR